MINAIKRFFGVPVHEHAWHRCPEPYCTGSVCDCGVEQWG